MAFGVHLVKGVEREKFEKFTEGVNLEDLSDDDNPAVSYQKTDKNNKNKEQEQASSVSAQTSPAQNRFVRNPQSSPEGSVSQPAQRFRRSSQGSSPLPPSSSSVAVAESKIEVPSPSPSSYASVKSSALRRKAVDDGETLYDESAHGENSEDALQQALLDLPQKPTAQELKSLRVRRMVQDVAEFKKWSPEDTEKAERLAMRNPDKAVELYAGIYRAEVQEARTQGVRTLEEALKKHEGSGDAVFLLRKKDKARLCVIPCEAAGSEILLHGATLESVPRSNTPFAGASFPALTEVSPPSPEGASDDAAPNATSTSLSRGP